MRWGRSKISLGISLNSPLGFSKCIWDKSQLNINKIYNVNIETVVKVDSFFEVVSSKQNSEIYGKTENLYSLLCSYSFDPDLRANKSSSMESPCSLFKANTRKELQV